MHLRRKGQQEIAGFVLIIVLVMIALMVFLVINAKKPQLEVQSRSVDNLLSSLMEYTTECVVSPPKKENVRGLIKSCYDNEKCFNSNEFACDHLNASLNVILPDLIATDSNFESFEFRVYSEDEDYRNNFLSITRGYCNQSSGSVIGGGPEIISVNDLNLKTVLKICTIV